MNTSKTKLSAIWRYVFNILLIWLYKIRWYFRYVGYWRLQYSYASAFGFRYVWILRVQFGVSIWLVLKSSCTVCIEILGMICNGVHHMAMRFLARRSGLKYNNIGTSRLQKIPPKTGWGVEPRATGLVAGFIGYEYTRPFSLFVSFSMKTV